MMLVLLAFSPYQLKEVEEELLDEDTGAPTGETSTFTRAAAMKLRDVVVVREKIGKRPLELDEEPDEMWAPVRPDFFIQQDFEGVRRRVNMNGELAEDVIPAGPLPSIDVVPVEKEADSSETEAAAHTVDEDELRANAQASVGGENYYRRYLLGGLLVESPRIISCGKVGSIRISWAPPDDRQKDGEIEKVTYGAEISFLTSDDAVLFDGQLFLQPPRLLSFFVDELRPVV